MFGFNFSSWIVTLVLLFPVAFPILVKKWRRRFYQNLVIERRRIRQIQFNELTDKLENVEKGENITSLSFDQLKESLQNEQYTAVQVLRAFQWKALEVQQKFNCITEFVTEAAEIAEKLDRDYKGKKKPPLFGLPFSVKDNFAMIGYDLTRGLASQLNKPRTDECSLISHLCSLGAVPFVRTNVPQTLISWVCTNPVYGTTINPHKHGRTVGGSSGGEACMVAVGGSAFGIASDLAGSLRIPAHCCGISTLKPSSDRLKATGAHAAIPGKSRLGLSYGFFANDVSTLIYLFKQTLTSDYFNRVPQTAPIPFKAEKAIKGPLKIGYFVDDGFLTPVPCCQRAVFEAIEKLESQGHTVVRFDVPEPFEAASLFQKSLLCDNGQYVLDSVRNEDVDPLMKQFFTLLKIPLFIRCIFSYLVRPYWPQLSVMAGSYHKNVSDWRISNERVDAYIRHFTQVWQDAKLDALICPGFLLPAVPNEYPAKISAAGFSTGLFNLLDFPAGVLPITKVTVEDDQKLLSEYPTPQLAKCNLLLKNPLYFMCRNAAMNSEGLPVGVQVVTLPYQEELCLDVMLALQNN